MHVRKANLLPVLLSTFFLCATFSSSAQFSISNDTLRVDLNVASGQFNITALSSQQTFVNGGQYVSTNGIGSSGLTTNAVFGVGQIIDIVYPGGNRDDVMLFSNLPFAIFQTTLSNSTAQTVISNSIHTLTLPEDLNEPTFLLSVRGTSGRSSVTSGASSYEWLAVADPTNRFGVVNGWITDDGATGMVGCTNADPFTEVIPTMQYGRLPIAPGQTMPLEMFAVGYFDDARVGLETWADTVAKVYNIHLPPQPTGFSTYPAVPHNGPCDSTNLPTVSSFASTNLEQFGFSVIQVDGRWEAGSSTNGNSPPRNFSTTTNVYPNGMKPMADYITSLGLTPGIWFQPFSGTVYDPVFTNHLDWFVTTNGGVPFFTGNFGGWTLDMSYPPARMYVSNIVWTFAHDWGFRYFKMDAFAAGLAVPISGQSVHPFGDAIYYDTNKTPVQVFRSGIQLLRQAAGTNVFFLGCNIPQNMRSYGASFGLVDAMRVGMDVAANWTGMVRNGVGSGSTHYFLNGRIWYDDPDTVYATTSLPLDQAQTYCSFVGFVGELTIDGDWLPDQTPDRINILQRIIPSHGLFARPVDYFETDPPGLWLLTDTNRLIRRDVIGLFNWGGADETYNVTLSHIGLPLTNYVGFDFWSNSLIPSISNSLQITVPEYGCSIIAVRPVSNRPQLLSTSRHITQGMVDVLSESWSDAANSLSGQSLVVGGDSYELRVVVPDNTWQAVSATVSAADQSAGVTAAVSQSGNLVRATILSPTNRQVSWSVSFSGPTNSPPGISAFSLTNQNLQISGTNGIWNYPFYLLGSSNLSLRSSNWQVLSTSYFDPGGNFSLTNPLAPGISQSFYRLMLP